MSDHYDIAVSFAGEQRDYVEKVVEACKALGLAVFYDRDKNNEWWGNNFIRDQRMIYSSQTRFFVPFLSSEYLQKPIPMDEFTAAMVTAVNRGDGYILPVLMGGFGVPADLLHPHISYLRSDDYSPARLAEELAKKVNSAKSRGQEPAELGPTVERALQFRMPKIVDANWSQYREIDAAFDHIANQFRRGASELEKVHLLSTVKVTADKIVVRVERSGQVLAGVDVRRGEEMGSYQISWLFGTARMSSNGFNGWAGAVFDKELGQARLKINDFSSFGSGDSGPVNAEGLFQFLWDKLIEQIEQH